MILNGRGVWRAWMFACAGARVDRIAQNAGRFQNGSMNITLKNVPDKVHRALKQEAKKQGRSLNAQIIQLLEAEAADVERRKKSRKWREELERFRNSLPPMEDSTRLIRQERDRH